MLIDMALWLVYPYSASQEQHITRCEQPLQSAINTSTEAAGTLQFLALNEHSAGRRSSSACMRLRKTWPKTRSGNNFPGKTEVGQKTRFKYENQSSVVKRRFGYSTENLGGPLVMFWKVSVN